MWLDSFLFKSPLQELSHQYYAKNLTVLAYHDIDCQEGFEQQIRYLAQRMHPVSLDEIVWTIQNGRKLPKHAVLITFDDGYRSIVNVGVPILKKYHMPGIVFVITSILHTNSPFWWDEAAWLMTRGARMNNSDSLSPNELIRRMRRLPEHKRDSILADLRQSIVCDQFLQPQLQSDELAYLESNGIVVGNHTHTHPALDTLAGEIAVKEVERAQSCLASILGHSPKAFAYPYGYINMQVSQHLTRSGYPAGFLFDHRIARLPIRDTSQISRVRVNASDSLARFAIAVSGLHPRIHCMLGRK